MRHDRCEYLSSHMRDFWCIPRIHPARRRCSCRCPRRSRLRRRHRRCRRPCHCLPRRRTRRSSSRPLRTSRTHQPHLLSSCTCPWGCLSRRRPDCVCVCHREKKVRTRKMITKVSLQHPRPRPSSRLANIISFHNISYGLSRV